jgi:hypothetical protein
MLTDEKQACAICRFSWTDEDSRTLICDKCSQEYHIFCLDPPLDEVPEAVLARDWFCPQCHPFGRAIELHNYFETFNKSNVQIKALSDSFLELLQCVDVIGKPLRLRIPNSKWTHTGRIMHRRRAKDNRWQHLVHFGR